MAKKKISRGGTKTLSNLIYRLKNYYASIEKYQDTDLEKFKNTVKDLRDFLQKSLSVENGYTTAFNHLIQNSQEYTSFKLKFTHAENFFERIIELDENEKVLSIPNDTILLNDLDKYLTNEFNKLFFQDVRIEMSKLKEHLIGNSFVMVGCGSLPITLLTFCGEYPGISFVGIDNSPEAIRKAIDLKTKFNIENLNFDIVDGMNYDYNNANTIFVANTVVPKIKVLKQIAMSAQSKARIIIRIPVLSGNLLSEDVVYNSVPRIHLLQEITPDTRTDDMLYKLLVLEIR